MAVARTLIILIYLISITICGMLIKCSHILSDFLCTFYSEDHLLPFDYIIVGAGSAGSVIANKLARNGKDKVLLLEAGKRDLDLLHIPAVGLLLQQTPFDWKYKTLPQQNACLGLNGNVSSWPMGKILGGTSMLNNMLYIRGHEQDFDEWFKDMEDYDYSKIIANFQELENNGLDIVSSEGPVVVSDLTYSTVLPSVILKAAQSLGYQILDNNYNSKLGFSIPKANLYKGKRWTPMDKLKTTSYENLLIKTNCLVEKVLFKSNFEAYGVQYNIFGKKYKALAKRGVVLSAGVIGTPKILMLSGIGPKNHLEHLNIAPIIDLPVGNNLQDHVTSGLDLVMLNHPLELGIGSMLSPSSFLEYFLKGSGPWTTTGCEAIAFFDTKNSSQSSDRPDVQFMVMPLGIREDDGYHLRKLIGISDRLWSDYFAKIQKKSMSILPVLLHPKSRGTVRLASKDPSVPPLIDPQYLTDPEDVEVLINGIELIKNFVKTEEFQALGAELNTNVLPGCAQHLFDTKDYWECYIRHLTITAYHPVGTCKMGKYEDPSTVVDFNFQVKGTNKLYIVDGSVLPSLSSGNVNAPILMLASMAGDLVRKNYYLSSKQCKISDIFIPETVMMC